MRGVWLQTLLRSICCSHVLRDVDYKVGHHQVLLGDNAHAASPKTPSAEELPTPSLIHNFINSLNVWVFWCFFVCVNCSIKLCSSQGMGTKILSHYGTGTNTPDTYWAEPQCRFQCLILVPLTMCQSLRCWSLSAFSGHWVLQYCPLAFRLEHCRR